MTTTIRSSIAAVAAGQHGVFTFEQVSEQGLTRHFIDGRIRNGEWLRLGHGVFAVNGTPPSVMRTMAAAVLSRRRAFTSGRSAAWLHRFPGVAEPTRVEITVPYSANSRSAFAIVRRSHHFGAIATTRIDEIPTATRCETIFRMSEYLGTRRLVRLVDDALLAEASAVDEIADIYIRHQGERMRGMTKLRPIIIERIDNGVAPTESELEALADQVLAPLDTPKMLRQVPIPWAPTAGRVDRLIESWKLIIELDGRKWHTRTEAFETDRRRDNAALANGYVTLRLTWRLLKDQPDHCRRLVLDIGRARSL